jgi:hypothetical protein
MSNLGARISITDLEKMMQTRYIGTYRVKLNDDVLGDKKNHVLEFDIFDGFAYCADYRGKEYYMMFPQKAFVKLSKEMEDEARDYLNLADGSELSEIHLLTAYNTLYSNN